VGGAVGLAVLATLSTTRTAHLLHTGHPAASALTSGYHLAFLIGAGLVLAAIVLALTVLRSETPAPAEGAYAAEQGEGERAGAEPVYWEAA
jgi:hypothetical protein